MVINTRIFNDTMMVVRLFGGNCGPDEAQTMQTRNLRKLKEGKVSVGDAFSHRFAKGGTLDITLTPELAPSTQGAEGCACTVTCPDGTTITACKVRSSCGNCG